LKIDPDYANAWWFLALSLEQIGQQALSITALEKAVSLSGAPHFRALLGHAYARAGKKQKPSRSWTTSRRYLNNVHIPLRHRYRASRSWISRFCI
jgi:hypothetical protein